MRILLYDCGKNWSCESKKLVLPVACERKPHYDIEDFFYVCLCACVSAGAGDLIFLDWAGDPAG